MMPPPKCFLFLLLYSVISILHSTSLLNCLTIAPFVKVCLTYPIASIIKELPGRRSVSNFHRQVCLVATLIIIQYRRRPRYINNNRYFHSFFGTLGLAAVLFNHRSVRDKGGSGEQRDGNDEDVLKHPITVRHVHILLQKTSACPSSTRPTWNKRCLVDRSMRQRRDPSRTIIRKRRLQ